MLLRKKTTNDITNRIWYVKDIIAFGKVIDIDDNRTLLHYSFVINNKRNGKVYNWYAGYSYQIRGDIFGLTISNNKKYSYFHITKI